MDHSIVAHWIYGENMINLDINDTEITDILERAINKRVKEKFNDADFINKVSALINQRSQDYLNAKMLELDIDAKIQSHINDYFDSAINIQTNRNQLTVMDNMTVNENEFVTNNLTVQHDAVFKGSLALHGTVNTDGTAWSELKQTIKDSVIADINDNDQQLLIDEVKQSIATEGINIQDIDVGNDPLISAGHLSSAIKYSTLTEVGTLKELEVRGEVSMNNDTLNVLNTRIGINTAKPTRAIDVWDQEVQITIGKMEKGVAYIGTSNQSQLRIGTENNTDIEINNGMVQVEKFKIGRNRIQWATQPPGHSGAPGDIVFNAGSLDACGWRCVGAYNWSKF